MKSRFVSIVVLNVLIATGAARAEVLERVIAKVNGEIITLSDIEQRQVAAAHGANIPPEKIEAFLQEKSGPILQEAIDDLLLAQKAEDLGIKVRPEALDQVIADIKKENKITSDEQFQAELAHEGLTVDALRRNVERSICRRRLISREVDSKITVPEDDIRAEYDRHKEEFQLPATVRLQEIVLKGDEAKTRATAEDIVKRARAGEDFTKLVSEYSVSATAKNGGDLGRLVVSELHSDLRRSIEGLAVGDVTSPATVGGNLRILKVNERTDARRIPYEEARATLEQRLRQDRLSKALEPYVAGLRKDAVVDVRVREVPHNISMPAANELPTLREKIEPNVSPTTVEDITPPAEPSGDLPK